MIWMPIGRSRLRQNRPEQQKPDSPTSKREGPLSSTRDSSPFFVPRFPAANQISASNGRAGLSERRNSRIARTAGAQPDTSRADHRCGGDIVGGLFKPDLDFVDSFGLEESPFCRVIVELENRAALLPPANAEHRLPNSVEGIIRGAVPHSTSSAKTLEDFKGAFADV